MFSMCYSKKQRLSDVLEDIAATCQAMVISNCSGPFLQFKIPTSNEEPVMFFGFHEQTFNTSQTSGFYDRIYADFSSYPDNYWVGDEGTVIKNDITYRFFVESQTDTYIELETSLSILTQLNDEFEIHKDNMVEGSFVYSKKPQLEKSNRMRVEFINRLMEYKIDIAEADDHYKQDILDGHMILRHYKLHGIKRGSQAARMALRYLDYEQYVNWLCSFKVYLFGAYLCVGDIIGVTHPITGWTGKYFRIIRKEEFEENESIIETEEYVPDVYHDSSIPIYQGGGGGTTVIPNEIPKPPQRPYAHVDLLNNRIYVTYSNPDQSSFVVWVNIYVKVDDGSYTLVGTTPLTPTASVIYSQYPGTSQTSEMEPTRTKFNEMSEFDYMYTEIPYDPLTMLGTFPASGYLWVNGELIYYNGIDTVNYKFLNCIRSVDVPDFQYAVDANDYGYDWTNPLIVLADTANAFYFNIDSFLD